MPVPVMTMDASDSLVPPAVNFIVYRLGGTTLVPCSRPQAHGAAASTPSLSAVALHHKYQCHLCQRPCQPETPCASAPGVQKQLLAGAHQRADSEEVPEGSESDSHVDLCRSNSDQDSDSESESCPHRMDLTRVGSMTAHSKFKSREQNFKLQQSQWRTKHSPVGGLFVRWSACHWQPE